MTVEPILWKLQSWKYRLGNRWMLRLDWYAPSVTKSSSHVRCDVVAGIGAVNKSRTANETAQRGHVKMKSKYHTYHKESCFNATKESKGVKESDDRPTTQKQSLTFFDRFRAVHCMACNNFMQATIFLVRASLIEVKVIQAHAAVVEFRETIRRVSKRQGMQHSILPYPCGN